MPQAGATFFSLVRCVSNCSLTRLIQFLTPLCLTLTVVFPTKDVIAATFVVDTTSDASLTACTATAADCSLRGAITNANLTTAVDTIEFNIPSSDAGFQSTTQHWRISVGANALPGISEGVLIDGYSQPGAIANSNTPTQGGLNGTLKIEIVPGSAFSNQQNGLDTFGNNFNAAASTFRGLVISRFFAQIQLGGGSSHRIEGCYLGTDISGTTAAVSTAFGRGTGVRLLGSGGFQIGGLQPAQRNLLSGLADAVVQQSSSPDGLAVAGNLIGTNAAGTQALPNTGIAMNFSLGGIRNARIGGTDPLARNVIAASGFWAILLSAQGNDPFLGTRIEGNFFGTDWTGTRALGNGLNPASPSQVTSTIKVGGIASCALTIGGPNPGQANRIAYSGKQGVENDQCRAVQAADNVFIGNRDIAFDNAVGGSVGATPNDPGDPDNDLGNRGQNFPELALGASNPALLQYRVDTALANATYPITVNFYRAGCGGGGAQRITSASISSGNAQQTLSIDLSAFSFLPLTAVAVDAAGNQSEFAPAIGDAIIANGFEDVPGALTVGRCD